VIQRGGVAGGEEGDGWGAVVDEVAGPGRSGTAGPGRSGTAGPGVGGTAGPGVGGTV